MQASHVAIWTISFISIVLMLVRPRNVAEVWWVGAGASALVLFRLISLPVAIHAAAKGLDVYLFLTGMMLLAELAQIYGVFDWIATIAVQRAGTSRPNLFAPIYIFGTFVTVFMSNDATALVLTPAVLAAIRKSKVEPLPYLYSCAFVANAASFVLPISNPANLVVFGREMPLLGAWFRMFLAASIVSIVATYFTLRWYCRESLKGELQGDVCDARLSSAGRMMLVGLGMVVGVLLIASSLGKDLGLPTFVASVCIAIGLSILERTRPSRLLEGISWSILPLVAGLFILVEAINQAGALHWGRSVLDALQRSEPTRGALMASLGTGLGTNLFNNLPLGLIAGTCMQAANTAGHLRSALLIGVDLGPNLSVTGSLATILWLIAIRKEGLNVSAWKFLKAGVIVMPPALVLATLMAALLR